MLHAAGVCCLCRPLPASNALSKSTSLGSAGQLHPAQAQPNMLDEGEDVVAEQPMQSPFGSPPPPDLPERHLGPPVQEDHSLDVRAASGSLLSPAARDFLYLCQSLRLRNRQGELACWPIALSLTLTSRGSLSAL